LAISRPTLLGPFGVSPSGRLFFSLSFCPHPHSRKPGAGWKPAWTLHLVN